MFIMHAFWVLALVAGIFFLVRWLSTPGRSHPIQPFIPGDDALETLKQRYARGDIEREEFRQKRRDLAANG